MKKLLSLWLAFALALSFVVPAPAEQLKPGHVLGNNTSTEREPRDATLQSVLQQSGSGVGTGVASASGNPVNAAGGLLTFGIIGTSGATIPLLNGTNTWGGANTFTASGTAGRPVVIGGPLGTPSSGSLINATGLQLSGLATQAASTLVGNGTAGLATPTALAVPTCANGLTWSGTAFGCQANPGAAVLLSTQTFTASASVSFTGLTSAYYNYKLSCSFSGSASSITKIQFGNPAVVTSTAAYSYQGSVSSSTTVSASSSTTAGYITGNSALGGGPFSYEIEIDNLTGAASNPTGFNPSVHGRALSGNVGISSQVFEGIYYLASSGAAGLSAIFVSPSAGTITGYCSLYGIAQ